MVKEKKADKRPNLVTHNFFEIKNQQNLASYVRVTFTELAT